MRSIFTAIILCFFLFEYSNASLTEIQKIDILKILSTDSVSIDVNSTFDIGKISNVFDNNILSVVRTPSQNPLTITLTFKDSILFAKSRILSTNGNYLWSIETAWNNVDLNNKKGTYKLILNKDSINENTWDSTEFKPYSTYIIRLTLNRITDNNYVQLNEWEIYQAVSHAYLKLTPDSLVIRSAWQKTIQKVELATDSGFVSIDKNLITFSSSNSNSAKIDSTGKIIALETGTAVINAKYIKFEGQCKVKVIESTLDVNANEISVTYISREPKIDYVWGSWQPEKDGWPKEGDSVKWLAHVKNWSIHDISNVKFKWIQDGIAIDSGFIDIPAISESIIELPWIWTFLRHELDFVVDPDYQIHELYNYNNSLRIYTDAISIGFYVEDSLYNYFCEYQHFMGARCWEDWAESQVRGWNNYFMNAVSPDAPDGVLDRIRIDEIVIVPDGTLPINSDSPTKCPNKNDRTVDLQRGFPSSLLQTDIYSNHTYSGLDNPFSYDGALFQAIGRARYLIDVFGFDVSDDGKGSSIAIKENGKFIAASKFMPYISKDVVHYTQFLGFMDTDYQLVDSYSAAALNQIAYHRATLGNYESPANSGSYLSDALPAENQLTIKDGFGKIIPDADIKVYQSKGKPGVQYGKYYDSIPDLTLKTDVNGKVLLGRCPFDEFGAVVHDSIESNCVLIIRVEKDGMVGYGFLEIALFNMQYWAGNVGLGKYEMLIRMNDTTSDIKDNPQNPNEFDVSYDSQNYESITNLDLSLYKSGFVNIKLFNLQGIEIQNICSAKLEEGKYNFEINSNELSAGVYFLTVSKDEKFITKKIYILK